MTFAHLHLHTDASIKDGLGTVRRTVNAAKDAGFKQLAVTDHGTLANAIRFTTECEQAGIKPIIGLEGYFAVDGEIGHITLLADGNKGFSNLVKLNNVAHKSHYRQPAFTVHQLTKYADDLVCLTGCLASPLQAMSLGDAVSLGATLKSAFGERLFAECMLVSDTTDSWHRSMQLASKLKIKPVLTNDVHFAYKDDAPIHPVLTTMKARFSYQSEMLYLQTAGDLAARAAALYIPYSNMIGALNRSGRIAKLIRPVNLKSKASLPSLGSTDPINDIYKPCSNRILAEKMPASYRDRLNYELDIIKRIGYPEYFLIMQDIVKNARRGGVVIGPGRGSGAGSLVLYLLGITEVDPIKYGLSFERFLNPERTDMPDVDVDFEANKRDTVLGYAKRAYGAIPISTYSTYSHRSLVRDLGRYFGVGKDIVEAACEHGRTSEEFDVFAASDPLIAVSYDAMIGQNRHKGKHAGGVIITQREVPIERIVKGELASSWTEGYDHDLSYAGVVKFDLLGLSVLSALAELRRTTKLLPAAPEHDKGPFEIFKNGDLTGVFQFSNSSGIRDICKRVQPEEFKDIYAINALYRPGPIDAGVAEKFHEYKKKPRAVPSFIKDILEETYGVIVYQEQFIEIYARAVKGTLAEGDTVRSAIVKDYRKAIAGDPVWVREFAKITSKFVDGCVKNHGLSTGEAHALWNEIKTFANYGFNKSHAVAYSLISWRCAWYKHHYPAEFYAAMLNNDPEKAQAYIYEAVARDIFIHPPNINKSHPTDYVGSGSVLWTPMLAVKFLGEKGTKEIERIRKGYGGTIKSCTDFMSQVEKRLVNARARRGIFNLGGFPVSGVDDEVVLGIKENEVKSTWERQLEHLGYVIPTKNMLDKGDKYKKSGFTVGIVGKKEQRTSNYDGANYVVYKMQPSGVFWSRTKTDIEEGTPAAVRIGKKGKLLEFRRLKF